MLCRDGGHYSARRDSRSEAGNERVWFFWSRTSLRQKEGRYEERVIRKLDNPDFSLAANAAGYHSALLKLTAIGRIDAVVAIVRFGHVLHRVERSCPGAGDDGDWLLCSDE